MNTAHRTRGSGEAASAERAGLDYNPINTRIRSSPGCASCARAVEGRSARGAVEALSERSRGCQGLACRACRVPVEFPVEFSSSECRQVSSRLSSLSKPVKAETPCAWGVEYYCRVLSSCRASCRVCWPPSASRQVTASHPNPPYAIGPSTKTPIY